MATNNLDFAAQIAKWVTETEGAMESVFHESAQRVTEVMTTPRGQGGNLPVDTGYLWHSFQASTSAPPPINPTSKGSPDQKYTYNAGPINLVINGAQLGQTVFICATASYAAFANYGTSKQAAAMFVELAAQQWPTIVNQVTNELKGRIDG